MHQDKYPSRKGSVSNIIERQDPITYTDWSDKAPITFEQYQFYRSKGFLVLENALLDTEIESLHKENQKILYEKDGIGQSTIIFEPGSDSIRSIFRIHTQIPLFRKLSCDERLIDLAEFILGDQVYIHQSRLNYKPGFDGKDFYWHSDFETWHVEDGMPHMRALSISVMLTENSVLNSPTMFVPGSHKLYVSCVGDTPKDHFKQSLQNQEYGVPDRENLINLSQNGIEMPTGSAGSLVIFDCNLLHGSNSNITPFPRANAFFVYNAVSNKLVEPFGNKPPRPNYIAEREDFEPINS